MSGVCCASWKAEFFAGYAPTVYSRSPGISTELCPEERLTRDHSAIYNQLAAGGECGAVGSKKHHRVGDIPRFAEMTERV